MVFNFKEWLLLQEDLDPTAHFKERVKERIENMKDVLLPQQLLAKIPTPASKIKEQAKKLIQEEISKRIQKLEKSTLAFDRNSGYPLISPYITHDGVDYPIIIVSEVKDEKTGIPKESRGNQVYIPIKDGNLMTIIPYPANMDELEIEKRQAEHSIRNFGESAGPFKMIPRQPEYVYKLEVKGGEVSPYKDRKSVPIDYTKEQQYNLGRGNKIKVFVKFAKGFVEGEIDKINNRIDDKFRDEGVGLDLNINVDGKDLKLPKKLPVGEIIELPIGEDGDWVKAEVVSPGYVIDNRMDEPINLKFKAKK
jgi:hypothetical protein